VPALARIFLPGSGRPPPVYGGTEIFQSDPWREPWILFYELLNGDNGAGIGAATRPADGTRGQAAPAERGVSQQGAS